MNKNQIITLWVGLGVFLLMGLFPPYLFTHNLPQYKADRDAGTSWFARYVYIDCIRVEAQ